MPQNVPPLSPDARLAIRDVIGRWGQMHPRRDAPLIRLSDGSELTPFDLARAAHRPESPSGRLLYRLFAFGTVDADLGGGRPLEQLLDPYRRDLEEWSPETR